MEFMNRSSRPAHPVSAPASNPAPNGNSSNSKKGMKEWVVIKTATAALLVSITVLVLSIIWFVVLGRPAGEARQVDTRKMQAVFLNGGQVYFGNIQDLTGSYIRLNNIYYLRVNQQVQPDQEEKATTDASDISLVKLGCELHGPEDEMLINRDQVIFWENLKSDGQVAKAVAEYRDANPNGQDCDETQSQSTEETKKDE